MINIMFIKLSIEKDQNLMIQFTEKGQILTVQAH